MRTTARTSSDLSYSPPFTHVLFALGLFPFPYSSHGILSFGVYPSFYYKHRRSFRFLACFPLLSFSSLDLPLCIQTLALRLCLHNLEPEQAESKET